MFHIDKLVNTGVIKPRKMEGKRGKKILYTLVSPAFLILPVRRDEKESFVRNLIEHIAPPRGIIVRSLIVGLLAAIFVVGMPWYLMGYRASQSLKVTIAESTTKGTPSATVPTTTIGTGKGEEAKPVFISAPSKASEDRMIILIFGVAASLLAALITAVWALHREGHLYNEHIP